MSITELRAIPVMEKLQIIETLWGDIAAEESAFESPKWHREVLERTEVEFTAGKIKSLDWQEAKEGLRSRRE
ncbi:MAG: addiction module protein [Verrucomicrobia bacterium]|nr:addiction module protein [Verrucomicrobiota bacterium]